MANRRARCPLCTETVAVVPPTPTNGNTTDVFRRHPQNATDPCEASGWLVEDEDYLQEATTP